MILLGDLGEQLEAGAAVLVAVFHTNLREDAGHDAGADATFGDIERTDAAAGRPGLVVLRHAVGGAEETCAGELLHADSHAHIGLARLDRHDGDPQRRGAGGAGVGDVEDRDAGLADLLLELLAHTGAGIHEVADAEDPDFGHGDAGIGERGHRSLGSQVDGVLVRVLAELRHVGSDDPDVICSHDVLSLVPASEP